MKSLERGQTDKSPLREDDKKTLKAAVKSRLNPLLIEKMHFLGGIFYDNRNSLSLHMFPGK